MTNNPGKELLDEMYKNVKMGCENICDVMPKIEDKNMKNFLTSRLEDYSAYAGRISQMMHERGFEPKEPGIMAKMGAKIGIAANTVIDSTSSHIAEMYIKGTKLGIIDLEKKWGEMSEGCDKKVSDLCREIIDQEKRDNERIGEFL